MNLRIEKYGGSSVATPAKIQHIAKSLVEKQDQGDQLVVVVSAMGETTNRLINLACEISDHASRREMDQLLVAGEQISIAMMTMAIEAAGGQAISLTGPQAGIYTNDQHGQGRITHIDTKKVLDQLQDGKIVIVAGFQGLNSKGDITTLGRGGSDVTAVALAAAFKAPCYIYTDVNGIHTVDPRKYPEAKKLCHITYDDALEMSRHGAKIMEPVAVEIAKDSQVPIYIQETLGSDKGTTIGCKIDSMAKVVGMAIYDNLCMAECEEHKLHQFEHVLKAMEKHAISPVFQQTSRKVGGRSLRFGFKSGDLGMVREFFKSYDLDPTVDLTYPEVDMITVVRRDDKNLDHSLVNYLEEKGCRPHYVSHRQESISFVVDKCHSPQIIKDFGNLLNL